MRRRRFVRDEGGQATVEYLVVGTVLLVVMLVFGQLLDVVESGAFASHASGSASHVVTQDGAGVVGDVFLY